MIPNRAESIRKMIRNLGPDHHSCTFPPGPPAELRRVMDVIDIKTFSGPSVYHNKPLLRMRLEIGVLKQSDSSQLPEFGGRLLTVLPGLWEHRCSKGRPGGFVERLKTGTWMAHIVEHMALER
jgi:hypothetical protein